MVTPRLSQHFLKDATVIDNLVNVIDPQIDDQMVEIGPGKGALTAYLLGRVKHVSALELDPKLSNLLQNQYSRAQLSVTEGDVLKTDFSKFGDHLRIVGNLPYHISSPILFHADSYFQLIKDMHFMLQKEVVERMVALPSTKSYGRLSVMLQYRWRVESLFDVSPTCFSPNPKVWSSVVRLMPIEKRENPAINYGVFEKVVKRSFSQRRKMLRNSLKNIAPGHILINAGIDPELRAEDLSVDDFINLANNSYREGL